MIAIKLRLRRLRVDVRLDKLHWILLVATVA